MLISLSIWAAGASDLHASVEPDKTDPAEVPPAYAPGVVPTAAALVPGVLLHGSGVYLAGDRDTALDLLLVEGVGAAGTVGGMTVLAVTGASRRTVGVNVAVIVSSMGLFVIPWFADLYGASTGGTDAIASLHIPRAQMSVGHRYVHDVQFDYRHLSRLQADLWWGRWQWGLLGWRAMDDDNQRLRLSARRRLYGRRPSFESPDASFVDVQIAGTYHGYETEGFRTYTGEGALIGRYDLSRIGAILRGAFAEMHTGWGLELYDYDIEGYTFGDDSNEMLLGGFAWGLYLGHPSRSHGEARIYYDHRRDDYAGGSLNGFAGHFGLDAIWYFSPDPQGNAWGLRLEAETGTASLAGLDLVYRWGAR